MWQFRRYSWEFVGGGPGSGLWKSTDGGSTWKKIEKDMPEGPLGRISLAIAPSNGNHVYALIHAAQLGRGGVDNMDPAWERLKAQKPYVGVVVTGSAEAVPLSLATVPTAIAAATTTVTAAPAIVVRSRKRMFTQLRQAVAPKRNLSRPNG